MAPTLTLRPGGRISELMAELNRAEISGRLQLSREQAGLTQPEMAELLHVHVNTIQNWENPTKGVPFGRLNEWASVCGVEVDWLLHGDELVVSADRAASIEELLQRAVGLLERLVPEEETRQSSVG
jgi:transcriptional regulator with XRE-family HTH domain